MAFVHDDEIEEVGGELAVNIIGLFRARDGLVERQVNFVGFVDLLGGGIQRCVQRFNAAIASLNAFAHSFTLGAELGHRAFEGAKVVDHGLVDQDVAISQKQNALFCAAFPQAPDDLEGGVGLASARGHDEERAVLPSADGPRPCG